MLSTRSLVVLIGLILPAEAAAWTPFPPVRSGSSVAVDRGLDGPEWDRARACLSNMSSRVGASYQAVVVPVTDAQDNPSPQANDAVPFVDAVALEWPDLEPERHVLIALGLQNRAVAIHPGSTWVGLGFERGVITRTIDGSSFRTFARASNYPEAVCVLARAIDDRLAGLEAAVVETKRRASGLLEALRQDFANTDALERRATGLDPELGVWASGQLAIAQERATVGREVLEHSPPQALAYAEDARNTFDSIDRRLTAYEQFVGNRPAWTERVESTRKAITSRSDADWEGPVAALEQLDRCEGRIADFGPAAMDTTAGDVESCFASVDAHLDAADSRYFVHRTVMPGVAAGGTLLIGVVLVIVLMIRRRRMERLVEAELARWSTALGTASERLLDLEQEFSPYFDSGRSAWNGDSAQLDQDCADEVNRLFLMFAKAQDIHRAAVEACEGAPALRVTVFEEVLERLRTVEVRIETGAREKRRRIFLPLSREYTASAAQLLEDLAGTYESAAALLVEATTLMEQVDALRVETSKISADCAIGLATRTAAGLPTDHLESLVASAEADWLGGRSIASSDPRRAAAYLNAGLEHFRDCSRLVSLGNAALEGVKQTFVVRREELSSRVGTMRGEGYLVREPGFDPDHELERLWRVGQAALQLLREREDETANGTWVAIAADLDALERAIQATAEAKLEVPQRIDELEEQHRENEGRVPNADKILKKLEKAHAPAAYDRESDNIDQIAALLALVTEGFASARAAYAEQRYLAAISDVEALRAMIAERRALLDELVTILERLEAARTSAHELFGRAAKTLSEVRRLCRSERGITDALANSVQSELSALTVVRELAASDRPHWLELHTKALGISMKSESLREEVGEEVAAYRVARVEYRQLDAKLVELLRRARRETRDRPHVEAMLIDAKKAIDAAADYVEHEGSSGTRGMLEVEKASKWLQRGRKAWESELQAFQSAEADLASAIRRHKAVDGASYGYGSHADASRAVSHIDRANEAVEQRKWEVVAQEAAAALVAISAAEDYAQFQADVERRRREAEAARKRAAAQASSYSSSSSSFSSSSSSSSFSSSSFSSSSSSGGSSFGSSSGGSSW